MAGAGMPILSFLYSLLMAYSAVDYDGGFPWEPISLLLGNIPTVILLAICFACREKFRK